MSQFLFLKKDIARLLPDPGKRRFRDWLRLLLEQRFYVLLIYRIGRWLYYETGDSLYILPLKLIYIILNKIIVEILFGIYLPVDCAIGPGLLIGNFCGLVINPRVKIGKNCSIGHGVIIGTAADGTKRVPEIGDNVFIGSRAILLGPISVGDNVRIGANALVNRDLPSGVTAVGVPARIVKGK